MIHNEARRQILNDTQIRQKIKRMAYQVYENNFEEKALILVGIQGGGYALAQMLAQELAQLSPLHCSLAEIQIDKQAPSESQIELVGISKQQLANSVIILCDDVLHTGKTLIYSLRCFINTHIRKIQTLVLVDRQHRSFPIAADYVGFRLATTLQEHISVMLTSQELNAYLY